MTYTASLFAYTSQSYEYGMKTTTSVSSSYLSIGYYAYPTTLWIDLFNSGSASSTGSGTGSVEQIPSSGQLFPVGMYGY